MPDWLSLLIAAGGGTGLGAILNVIFAARGSAYTQLHALVDQLQEDRQSDRKELAAYSAKVDAVLLLLEIEREYSLALHAWALAGAPPPPPARRLQTPVN